MVKLVQELKEEAKFASIEIAISMCPEKSLELILLAMSLDDKFGT